MSKYFSYAGYLFFAIGTILIIAKFDMLLYLIIFLVGALFQLPDYYIFAKEKLKNENDLALYWVAKFIGFIVFSALIIVIIFLKYILPNL